MLVPTHIFSYFFSFSHILISHIFSRGLHRALADLPHEGSREELKEYSHKNSVQLLNACAKNYYYTGGGGPGGFEPPASRPL